MPNPLLHRTDVVLPFKQMSSASSNLRDFLPTAPTPSITSRPYLRASSGQRAAGALLALISLAVLCTAASLHPDPRGVETHTQLGLWPCGWYMATGKPCPTCGMTTAFAAAARGSYFKSLTTQPFAFILSLATSTAFWAGLHIAIFGSRLGSIAAKLLRPRFVWITTLLLGLSWVYKMASM